MERGDAAHRQEKVGRRPQVLLLPRRLVSQRPAWPAGGTQGGGHLLSTAGDLESLTEAQLRYKDFANRFPNDPNRAYALLMLGKVSYAQRKGPMRDLTPVREAADNLGQLVRLFPKSPYTEEGKELQAKCLEELAQHEFEIAQFYANIGAWQGAKQRLDYLFANYPDTATAKAAAPLMEKVLEQFGRPTAPRPTPAPTKQTADQH